VCVCVCVCVCQCPCVSVSVSVCVSVKQDPDIVMRHRVLIEGNLMIITREAPLGRERPSTTHNATKLETICRPGPVAIHVWFENSSRDDACTRALRVTMKLHVPVPQMHSSMHTWRNYFFIVGAAQLNFFCEWFT
jgi:hypothetical protein